MPQGLDMIPCTVTVIFRIEVDEVKPTGFATQPASVPYLPFLVGVLVAMLGVTVIVVQQTS